MRREVVAVGRARRATQQQPGLADLRAVEEPFAAPQQVGHLGVGQRLLVGLALAVGAEQDGDLARGDALGDQRSDASGHPVGLGRLVGVLAQVGGGAGRPHGDQLDTRCAPRGARARIRLASATTCGVER